MIQGALDQVDQAAIASLIGAKVSEGRTLDYKQQLPGASSEEKREFLYDVSSFANALGGDLVFGIAEERDAAGRPTGLPASASGIAVDNLSGEVARLENLTRDGIDPRISPLQWKAIDGFPSGSVVVMRIPKSPIGPHMVVFGGMARFYSRNSTGKYPMDIGEIRAAFADSLSVDEKLRLFREGRLERFRQGQSYFGANGNPKLVVHLIPLASFSSIVPRDITRDAAHMGPLLEPIKGSSWGGRYNFDGYLVSTAQRESYVQVFRSGVIEAGALPFLGMPEQYKGQIPGVRFEQQIIQAVSRYLEVHRRITMPLPVFVAISLLGVRGYRVTSSSLLAYGSEPIDREDIELPEVAIENYDEGVAKRLRPAFDALWQACGVEQSLNYDTDGNWRHSL